MAIGDWSRFVLAAVGDVFLNRDDPGAAFSASRELLALADLRFANSEGVYTDRREVAPSSGFPVISAARNAEGLRPAGFDVMSVANNHTVDAGHSGLADTLDCLRRVGIRTVGAGATLAQARAPVIREVNGCRIAMVAGTSVYQPGYEARAHVPGVAPLRVLTSYYHADWDPYGRLEPGSRPQIATAPLLEDLEALNHSVRTARAEADVVLVSCHWGDSSRPAFLHDYEKAYGRAAIDGGADAVLGHHHHFLRGAELYRGKPIFYGLGHFAFDLPGLETVLTPEGLRRLHAMGEYAIYPRAGWPLLPFHPDARMSVMAFCTFGIDRTVEAYLLPCVINPANQPVPCGADSEPGQIVADYLRRISAEADLTTSYAPSPLPVGNLVGLRLGSSHPSQKSPI